MPGGGGADSSISEVILVPDVNLPSSVYTKCKYQHLVNSMKTLLLVTHATWMLSVVWMLSDVFVSTL